MHSYGLKCGQLAGIKNNVLSRAAEVSASIASNKMIPSIQHSTRAEQERILEAFVKLDLDGPGPQAEAIRAFLTLLQN